jgi:hypothetical protein
MVGPCLVTLARAGEQWRASVRVSRRLVIVVVGSWGLVGAVAQFAPICARKWHTLGKFSAELSAYARSRGAVVLNEDRDELPGAGRFSGDQPTGPHS